MEDRVLMVLAGLFVIISAVVGYQFCMWVEMFWTMVKNVDNHLTEMVQLARGWKEGGKNNVSCVEDLNLEPHGVDDEYDDQLELPFSKPGTSPETLETWLRGLMLDAGQEVDEAKLEAMTTAELRTMIRMYEARAVDQELARYDEENPVIAKPNTPVIEKPTPTIFVPR